MIPRFPVPVSGPDGETKALQYSFINAWPYGNVLFWQPDMEFGAKPMVLFETASPEIPALGGLTRGAYHGALNTGVAYEFLMSWLTGDTVDIGNSTSIGTVTQVRGAQVPLSLLFLSRAYAKATPIPGIEGALGLDASSLMYLGIAPNFPTTGIAQFGFRIPADPALRGKSLALQSLILDNGAMTLTNTAPLRLR
jgi:hypothetical protein